MIKKLLITFLCIWKLGELYAQNDSIQLYQFTADDVLNSKKQKASEEVFSASKLIENRNLAPATVYVITEEDIISNGYTDLKDILENTAGITVIDPNFFVFGGQRGYVGNFSQTLLLINGREVQNLIAAETFISYQFATHNIKQVEII